jgi:eukaryotic-like serine/threonine-protein kinase
MLTLNAGTRLAQYEIVAPLGSGGMGEVYRAHDARLERDVAIKVLPQHLALDPDVKARFEREARAVAALSHPGILAIHELAKVGDLSFAVMELLEGETLRQRLAERPMPWREAVALGTELADAVSAAHARGIVHRDLKPENIFLTREPRLKVLDFGLARSADAAAGASSTYLVTSPGVLLGTIGYIAPEQIAGAEADAASDIFAIGCVLYEMLSGRMAFGRTTAAETMSAIMHAEPPPLDNPGGDAPPELELIVRHCLAKRPDARFPSARDLTVALRALEADSAARIVSTPLRTKRAAAKSVAVLPFDNLTGDPDADYLSDGLTESIINCLSQLPKLRVVPRGTVFRYKGRADDATTVGLALNVRSLVSGRIVRRGATLNIQVELIDVATESQLWGDQYQREAGDVASVQQEIAFQVSEGLRVRLSGAERKRLKAKPTENNEAYQHYLRGRYYWNKWTPEGFARGIECFEKAIETDPNYALAWAGLGDAYATVGYYGTVPTAVAMPKARFAALKALELDHRLPEAHVTMAFAHVFHDWDWAAAEREFKLAIALNPRLATAHAFYGLFSAGAGDAEAGVARAVRGRDLDPLNMVTNIALVWSHYLARQYDKVIETARRALELDPTFTQIHTALGAAYDQMGDYRHAAKMLAEQCTCWGSPLPGAEVLPGILERDGSTAYFRKQIELMRATGDAQRPPMAVIIAYIRVGEFDEAIARIERLVDERTGHAVFAHTEPSFDPVRSHPRFQAILQRLAGLRSPALDEARAGHSKND